MCFYLSVFCWYQRRRLAANKKQPAYSHYMKNQQGRPRRPMHGSNKQILFQWISSTSGFKVVRIQTPQEVIMSVGFISQKELCLVNSGIKKKKKREKKTPQLSRRLSQVACLLKEEYFTIKMFLW